MTAFDALVGALFADPNLSLPALWRAGGTAPAVSIRLLWRNPDEIVASGERRFVATGRMAEVRISEAPTLVAGDTIAIGSDVMAVLSPPETDDDRLVWIVSLGAPET